MYQKYNILMEKKKKKKKDDKTYRMLYLNGEKPLVDVNTCFIILYWII